MNIFNEIDKKGQTKVVDQLTKIFSAYTLTIDQHYIDSSTVDIYVTASTSNNKEYYYVIEAKDRKYNHNQFNSWIIEDDKKNELLLKTNYKPLYINTFQDNWIGVWDLSQIKFENLQVEKKWLPKNTVIDKGKKYKDVYYLDNYKCVYFKPFV